MFPLSTTAHATNPRIDSVVPISVLPQYVILISGGNFGDNADSSTVIFSGQNGSVPVTLFRKWTDTEIVLDVPEKYFAVIGDRRNTAGVGVVVEKRSAIGAAPESSSLTSIFFPLFTAGEEYLTSEAIALKKKGMNEHDIANHLRYAGGEIRKKYPGAGQGVFGNSPLSSGSINALKAESFSTEFIKDMEGDPQRDVTIGLAMVWMTKTTSFVPAPMVRIYPYPKKRRESQGKGVFIFDFEDFWDRFDINFGITTETDTAKSTDGGAPAPKRNYVLIGVSFEINRSALVNYGIASAIGDTKYEMSQPYIGITLDSGFFRELGLLGK